MKRLSVSFLVVLVSVLVFASASTTALAAPATKESFSAALENTETSTFERLWIEEGRLHVRGLVMTADIKGDIVGQVEITVNINIGPSGYGDEQIKGVITVGGEEAYKMTADLTIEPTIGGALTSGNFAIHGMGSWKGIHITGTLTSTTPTYVGLAGTKLTTKP